MKHLYKIKQTCMIDLCLYEAGQEVMLDDSKASKSLTELIEPKTDKSVTSYDNKMINSAQLKTKKQKKRKLLNT